MPIHVVVSPGAGRSQMLWLTAPRPGRRGAEGGQMVTQINVFVCELCFIESVVVNEGLDIWNEPTVIPPEGEEWGYVGERFACPACVEKSRAPVEWKLGDELGLRLDQVSDEETRDLETVGRMLAEINQVVAGYGFKIRQWGRWPDFRRSAVDEEAYLKEKGWIPDAENKSS